MMEDVSLAAAFGRLLVVAVLMAAVLLVLRRTTKRGSTSPRKRGGTSGRAIELVDRQALGKTQSVAVLRVHDTTLVVGVTDQRIELLATLDPAYEDASIGDLDLDGDDDFVDLTGYELRDDDEEFFAKLRRRSAR